MNWADAVPFGVVTVNVTIPLPAGLVAVICVSLSTVKTKAAVPPNETPVAPVKPVPVMVTMVTPAAGPLDGLIFDTVGLGVGLGFGVAVGLGFGVAVGLGLGVGDGVGVTAGVPFV